MKRTFDKKTGTSKVKKTPPKKLTKIDKKNDNYLTNKGITKKLDYNTYRKFVNNARANFSLYKKGDKKKLSKVKEYCQKLEQSGYLTNIDNIEKENLEILIITPFKKKK